MSTLSRIFSNWFTAGDNRSYELGRALWAISVIAGLGFQGFDIWWNGSHFNMVEFGTGVGSILALGGVGIAVKENGVPKPAPRVVTGGPTVVGGTTDV